MEKFIEMKKKVLFLIWGLFILFCFQSSLFAYDDWTYGPLVNTISGPTTGIVGETYTFSANISATADTPIKVGRIYETTNITTSQESNILVWENAEEGSTTCTTLECDLITEFIPESPGTYYIFVGVGFFYEPENETATSCNTHPEPTESGCFDSRGKYITFVVSGEESLPETATIPTRTYVLISSGLLLILFSFVVKNINLSDLESRKREKFEKKF